MIMLYGIPIEGIERDIEDLYIVGGIIADKFPSYSKMFSAFINGKMIIPYNMFIMKHIQGNEDVHFIMEDGSW